MKKIISVMLLLVMLLTAFAACSGKNETSSNPTSTPATASKPTSGATTGADTTNDPTSSSSTPVSDTLTRAKDMIYEMYKNGAVQTGADYTVTGVVAIDDVKYTVVWSADTDNVTFDVGEKTVTVKPNIHVTAPVDYVLTATITDSEGNSVSTSFNRTIPAYVDSNTWAEYVAAEDGSTIKAVGVVTGIISKTNGNSKNGLYFQDADGGYYAYDLEKDPVTEGIKVGMNIKVTGNKTTYNGTYELDNCVVEILNETIQPATAADYTESYKNATTLKDEALVAKQALLVTVKDVVISTSDDGSGYYKFKLGELESYIRISSSVCPLTKDQQDKLKADHASHFGYTADVTGVICVYSGNFYLTPVDTNAFVYKTAPSTTDAEKVATEKGKLSIPTSVSTSCELTISATGALYNDVVITWASDSSYAVVNGTKLVITLPNDAEATAKITATLKCGDVTDTVEFTLTIPKNVPAGEKNYKLATSLKDGDKVIIYNVGSGMALSEEDLSATQTAYRKGEAITVTGDTITTSLSTIVWNVVAVDGGFKFVADNGMTLSCTGKKLLLGNEDNVWTVSEALTENNVYIASTTGKGSSGDPCTIEWYAQYTEFSTHYYSAASEAIFAMQLFVEE